MSLLARAPRGAHLLLALCFPGLLATGGCVQLAAFPEQDPFVAPGTALQVAWRRQLTDPQLFGGSDAFVRDGKITHMSTGIVQGYKPQEFAATASDGRRVFVGSSHGLLYALSSSDGRLLWRRPLSGPISSEPSYNAELGLLLVGDDDGALWAIDPSNGKERWVYRTRGPITAPPVYADGIVFFTTTENRVYAVDAVRGTWKWQYDREAPEGFTIRGQGGALHAKGRIYVGFSDGHLACLEARTGDIVWVRPLSGEGTRYVDVDSTPAMVGGTLYASSVSGGVFALDPKDGAVKWRYEVDGAGTVRVRDGRVYFSAGKAGLHCLDLAGRLVWRQALANAGELSTPLLIPGWVVVSAAGAGAYVVDAESGRLDQFLAPGQGITGPPTTDGKHVFVVSNAGFLWAMSIEHRLGDRARAVAARGISRTQ